MDRFPALDFEQASIRAAPAALHRVAFAERYFRLAQSVYWSLQQHGLQAKCAPAPELTPRSEMPPATAFPLAGGAMWRGSIW